MLLFHKAKLRKFGYKTGFTIAPNVFGYGLVIPHYGTIVVGDKNKIGNYAELHTSICITAGEKTIGDGLYCSTGSKIISNINLGDFITIGANAVVDKSAISNKLLVGIPAVEKDDSQSWYHGESYCKKVAACEKLKIDLGISL